MSLAVRRRLVLECDVTLAITRIQTFPVYVNLYFVEFPIERAGIGIKAECVRDRGVFQGGADRAGEIVCVVKRLSAGGFSQLLHRVESFGRHRYRTRRRVEPSGSSGLSVH